MPIGIRLHDTASGTLAQRAAIARAQGFTCVHLALSKTLSEAFATPQAMTEVLAAEVQATLGGLSVAVLGCYLNLTHPDEAAYANTLERYRAHLQFSCWLGGCAVGTETGNPNADYRFDPQTSHSEESLGLFVRRLTPVVREAESLGARVLIEPVYRHIVSTPERARRLLDAVASPSLGIILDPVNLLDTDNLSCAGEVLAEAFALLGKDTAVMHIKDYVRQGNTLRAVAAGQGEMDFSPIFDFLALERPDLPIILENTVPDNAEAARRFVADGLAHRSLP